MRITHEILKAAVERVGVKKIAGALDVSTSLVYKWCQPKEEAGGDDGSGANNPLDRLLRIIEVTQDIDLIHFICQTANGFFTPNPEGLPAPEARFISETVQILDQFADLMRYAERSLHNDGAIDDKEARHLRKDWDKLKSRLEHFVVSCEKGFFNRNTDQSEESPETNKALD